MIGRAFSLPGTPGTRPHRRRSPVRRGCTTCRSCSCHTTLVHLDAVPKHAGRRARAAGRGGRFDPAISSMPRERGRRPTRAVEPPGPGARAPGCRARTARCPVRVTQEAAEPVEHDPVAATGPAARGPQGRRRRRAPAPALPPGLPRTQCRARQPPRAPTARALPARRARPRSGDPARAIAVV